MRNQSTGPGVRPDAMAEDREERKAIQRLARRESIGTLPTLICPTCEGQKDFTHGFCNAGGCHGCAFTGEVECGTCQGIGIVAKPLKCPSCLKAHGGELIGALGLDYEPESVVCNPCLQNRGKAGPRLVAGDVAALREAYAGDDPDLSAMRKDSLARRWDTDSKPCGRCGHEVLWRHEGARRVAIDSSARLHACPQ